MYGGSAGGYGTTVTGRGSAGGVGNAYANVSYDTSSQDPVLVRSRVFAGNINNQHVTREQLIDLYSQYGRVIGLTFFKGYAFVQYTNDSDAQLAVMSTNGMQLAGQAIDVKLAASQQKNFGKSKGGFGGGGGGGNTKRELTTIVGEASALRQSGGYLAMTGGSSTPAKVARLDIQSGNSGRAASQTNAANSKAALKDTTTQDDLASREVPDTMICGTCRHVFNDFIEFRDHRKAACNVPSKPDDEPEEVVCFVCKEAFAHSWTLLGHLSALHHLTVFASDDPTAVENNDEAMTAAATENNGIKSE